MNQIRTLEIEMQSLIKDCLEQITRLQEKRISCKSKAYNSENEEEQPEVYVSISDEEVRINNSASMAFDIQVEKMCNEMLIASHIKL